MLQNWRVNQYQKHGVHYVSLLPFGILVNGIKITHVIERHDGTLDVTIRIELVAQNAHAITTFRHSAEPSEYNSIQRSIGFILKGNLFTWIE